MEKKEKKKPIQAMTIQTKDAVYDAISLDGEMAYLCFDGEKQEVVGRAVTIGPKTYETPYERVPKNLCLPTGLGKLRTAGELFEQAKNLADKGFFHPDPRVSELNAQYIVSTYTYDRYPNVGYSVAYGIPGTGKSRRGHVHLYTCYNALHVNGSMSEAAFFRYIDKIRGTMVMDESQRSFTDIGSDWHKMLMEGFSCHGSVSRCENNPKSGEIEPRDYSVFGPKVLASRVPEHEDALASRSFSIKLSPFRKASSLPVVEIEDGEWQAAAAAFRNDALLWRQRRALGAASAPGLDYSALVERFTPRQLQVVKFLLDEAAAPETQRAIVGLALEGWAKDKKAKTQTIEGMIAHAAVVNLEGHSRSDRVFFTSIVATMKSWGYASITPKAVGKFFESLSVETSRTSNGNYAIIPSLDMFKQRCEEYGVGLLEATFATRATSQSEQCEELPKRLGEFLKPNQGSAQSDDNQ